MPSSNAHIRQFLSYYCKLNSPPEYAVLLKGLWGTGKTWFIQDCLKELENEGLGHLYVSLYGVTYVEDIEAEFFRQLHPLLASKGVKLLGKLAKGLVKATVKFDIDGDDSADGSLTVGVPNEKFIDSLKDSERKVLVFDDVERCGVPICHVLGYINKFVEHCGSKVILIANEKEINDREKDNKGGIDAYQRVKEKLVGKTFEIVPEIASALANFIISLQSSEAKVAVEENKELITQLYYSSGYRNLRILRHALWEFDRLISQLQQDVPSNKPFVTHFLAIYLVYSFETMSGSIFPKEISMFGKSQYSLIGNRRDQPNPYQKYLDIKAKYQGVDLYDPLFHESVWEAIFDEGFIPSAAIDEAIRNSKYFQSNSQPNWVRLWHARDLSDSEFELVLSAVDAEWNALTYTEIGIVKHVAGTLLWLSEVGLYQKSKKQILTFSKRYVDSLKKKGHLTSFGAKRQLTMEDLSWGGLGFHSNEDDEFRALTKYILEKEKEASIQNYPSEASVLLEYMENDTEKFYRSLVLCNHEDNKYYEIPILSYVSPTQFVDVFLRLPPDRRATVAYAFGERYKVNQFNRDLISEITFLKKVIRLLSKKRTNLKGTISHYTIGLFINAYIGKSLAILESVQKDISPEQIVRGGR